MKVIIAKFGGNLLKDEENRSLVINKIIDKLKNGDKVIAIVSAMGRKGDPYATDTLLEEATHLSRKDKDRLISQGEIISSLFLANNLAKKNILVHPLNEREIGILTNSDWGSGKIISINPLKIHKLLNIYDVLVVPGFIGINKNADIVTLGRGGSDFTAVIIAHMLGIKRIEVYKDVDGVLSGNPKYVQNTKKLDYLSFEQMEELSLLGAQVLQTNAIIGAHAYGIEIEVIPLFSNKSGTLISFKPCKEKYIAIMNDDKNAYIIGNINEDDITIIDDIMKRKFKNYQLIFKENVIQVIASESEISKISNNLHEKLISNVNQDLGIYFSGDKCG
jgi:aspartate kinase